MSVSKEEQEVLKIISNSIQNIRFTSGKTQQEMANILQMDRGNYTKIENGDTTRKLKFSQLITLSKELNVSLDYIFGLIGEASPNVTIKEIYKEYGLTEESLKEIKNSSEYLKENLNYFIENIGLLEITIKTKEYADISVILNKIRIIVYIRYLSDYILDKLKENQRNKLKTFFDYCKNVNNQIFETLLGYDVDYRNIFQYFNKLYNLIFNENDNLSEKREKEIKELINKLNTEYYKVLRRLVEIYKIRRLDLIEKMQYFLDGIRFSSAIEIGSKEFTKLFGEDEKELEKYLGSEYQNNKKYFDTTYTEFL